MNRTPKGPCPKCGRECQTSERIRVPSRSGRSCRILCPECCAGLPDASRSRIAAGDFPRVRAEMRCHDCNVRFGDRLPVPLPNRSGRSTVLHCLACACNQSAAVHRRLQEKEPLQFRRVMKRLMDAHLPRRRLASR